MPEQATDGTANVEMINPFDIQSPWQQSEPNTAATVTRDTAVTPQDHPQNPPPTPTQPTLEPTPPPTTILPTKTKAVYFFSGVLFTTILVAIILAFLFFLPRANTPSTTTPSTTTTTTTDDPFRYDTKGRGHTRKTNSYMDYMPIKDGFMQTHETYRFMSVREQVMTVIGEAKHGLWRIHDNGLVRLFRQAKNGSLEQTGLPLGIATDGSLLTPTQLQQGGYAAFLPKKETPLFDGWSGWRYAQEDDGDGKASFIDIPIHHLFFQGKYTNHVPIDLPHFYCTMSGPEFTDAAEVWKYATMQPNANQIGPLGKRAGLDITEHYTNVIRLELFNDAKIWINVADVHTQFNQTVIEKMEERVDNRKNENKRWSTSVKFRALDTNNATDVEVYLIERPFFNVPYIFITVVIDNHSEHSQHPRSSSPSSSSPAREGDLQYMRPDGLYWNGLTAAQLNMLGGKKAIKQTPTFTPTVPVLNVLDTDGTSSGERRQWSALRYTPFYGLNHLNRPNDDANGGGFCPQRGGDWGAYPFSPSGAGFANQYEETTPLCDAVVLDVKLYANLDKPTWNSPLFQLMNAGTKTNPQTYLGQGNQYGRFTDPYLVSKDVSKDKEHADLIFTNPQRLDFTKSDYKNTMPAKMPLQAIDVLFEDGVGVGLRYVDPSSKKMIGGSGLTVKEQEKRNAQLAESTN